MNLTEKNQCLRKMVRYTMTGELNRQQYYENRRLVMASCTEGLSDAEMVEGFYLIEADDLTMPSIEQVDLESPTLPDAPVVQDTAAANYKPYAIGLVVILLATTALYYL